MPAQPKQSEPQPTTTRSPDPEATDLALDLAGILDEKQAEDIAILDVSGPLVIADYFVIATARNLRHAQAMARELDTTMKHAGRLRRNMAGVETDSNWVLLDFNEVVVHLFLAESRAFYALESLWADVPQVEFEAGSGPAAPAAEAEQTADRKDPHVIRPRRPSPGEEGTGRPSTQEPKDS